MKSAKILFLDIDDTLLTRAKTITDENRAAIDSALRAGHRIVICSGRPHFGVLSIAGSLGLDGPGCYLISYNGGQIWDCGEKKAVYRKTVSYDDVRLCFNEADREGIHCQTYDSRSLLVRHYNRETKYYTESIHVPFREVPELPDGLTEEPVKVLLISFEGRSKLDPYRAEILRQTKGRLSLFQSNPWYLECVPAGISKGFAVRFLCDYLGIPIENSVSAGDSENDLPMIEAAGTGCAVANATDACKAAADYVTENDCDHSAVAEIIRRFIL